MFILASIISRKKAKGRCFSSEAPSTTDIDFLIEALAASSVKIAGRDVLATWKVLIALGVTPVLYAVYAIIATVIAFRANAPLKWRLLTPFIVASILPFANLAALKFGEAGMDVVKYAAIRPTLSAQCIADVIIRRSLPPLIVALLPGQQRYLEKVKTLRENLANEVASLINDFGPKIYDDFDGVRTSISRLVIDFAHCFHL